MPEEYKLAYRGGTGELQKKVSFYCRRNAGVK